jgi:hypothetical protein
VVKLLGVYTAHWNDSASSISSYSETLIHTNCMYLNDKMAACKAFLFNFFAELRAAACSH